MRFLIDKCCRRRQIDHTYRFRLTSSSVPKLAKRLGFSASRVVIDFRHTWSNLRRRQQLLSKSLVLRTIGWLCLNCNSITSFFNSNTKGSCSPYRTEYLLISRNKLLCWWFIFHLAQAWKLKLVYGLNPSADHFVIDEHQRRVIFLDECVAPPNVV